MNGDDHPAVAMAGSQRWFARSLNRFWNRTDATKLRTHGGSRRMLVWPGVIRAVAQLHKGNCGHRCTHRSSVREDARSSTKGPPARPTEPPPPQCGRTRKNTGATLVPHRPRQRPSRSRRFRYTRRRRGVHAEAPLSHSGRGSDSGTSNSSTSWNSRVPILICQERRLALCAGLL